MRLSPDARCYAYVARAGHPEPTVTVVDVDGHTQTALGAGQDPRWADAERVFWRRQADGVVMYAVLDRLADGSTVWRVVGPASGLGGNSLAVLPSGHTAVHRTDPRRVIFAGGGSLDDVLLRLAWPVASDSGTYLAMLAPDQPLDGMQSVVVYDTARQHLRTIHEGAVSEGTQGSDFRMAGTTLCFKEADGRVYGVVDVANHDLRPELLAPAGSGVSHACPVYVPDVGLYVLYVQDLGEPMAAVRLATWTSMVDGSPRGWEVGASTGSGYEHDARRLADGVVRLVYLSANGAPQRRDVTLSLPMVDLPFRQAYRAVGTPVSSPRALGYFFDHGRYGDYAPARNCTIVGTGLWVDGDGHLPADVDDRLARAIDATGRAFVSWTDVDRAVVRARWNKVLGLFIHEPSVDECRRFADEARALMRRHRLPRRPVVAVLGPEQAMNDAYDAIVDAVAPEVYFDAPAGSYEAQRALTRQRCVAVAVQHDVPVFLVVQAYDRTSLAWSQRLDALEAIQQGANEAIAHRNVAGLWWFAYARPGGVRDYPQLGDWHAAQVAVTPPPTLFTDPVDPPDPPEPPMPDHTFTLAQVDGLIDDIAPEDLYLGARQRFRDEVLLPRDRVVEARSADGQPANAADLMTGGAAMFFDRGYARERLKARFRGQSQVDASVAGLLGAAADYRRAVGIEPSVPTTPTTPGAVSGRLRVEAGRARGDAGFETYVGMSAFCLIGHAAQGRKPEAHRQLNEAAGHPARVFCMLDPLNGGFGPVQRFGPLLTSGWDEAADFVVHEAGFRGSRVQLNIFADAQRLVDARDRRREILRYVARRYKDLPHVWFRIANEPYQNGWSRADDSALLDLARELADILGHNHFAIGDVPDRGSESGSPEQEAQIAAQAALSTMLVVHSDRAEQPGRERPVEHMKSVQETYRRVAPDHWLLFDENRGFASVRQPGRRDNRPAIALADAATAAVLGCGYTYHRIAEQDPATPGWDLARTARDIPTSPDYRFENANTGDAWVRRFSGWDKVRPAHNGAEGWACAIGPTPGAIEVGSGWRPEVVQQASDATVAVAVYRGRRV